MAVSTAVSSSGASTAICVAALASRLSLVFSCNDLAVHHQQPLRNRAAVGFEFLGAAVAIAIDEFALADLARQPHHDMRSGIDRRQRSRLQQCADHLLGPQARQRKHGPVRFVPGVSPSEASSAVVAVEFAVQRKRLRSRQSLPTALPSRSRARRNRRPECRALAEMVLRAVRLSIGSTSGRPNMRAQARLTASRAKARLLGMRHPTRPAAAAAAPSAGSSSALIRHAAGNRLHLARRAILDLVVAGHVANAAQAVLGLAEERRQALEIALLPRLERMVVALGAVDAHAQKRARDPRGQVDSRRGPCLWSGWIVTVMKFVAGVSVHRPESAIKCRTISS